MLRLLNDRCFQYFLASLFFTTFGELLAQSAGVPQWFLKPPSHNKYYYGAGLATLTYDSTESIENARRFAAQEIVKSLQVRIKGGVADISSKVGSETAFFVVEKFDEGLAETIYKNAVVLKSTIEESNIYILIYINTDFSTPKKSLIINFLFNSKKVSKGEPPAWLDTIPVKNGYMYGVSKTESYHKVSESWTYSGKLARYRVASMLKEDSKSLIKKYDDGLTGFVEVMTETSVNQALKNSIIKYRWYDQTNHHYCTLVEYKIKKVK